MATITTINSGDSISSSRTVINTNFSNLNTDKVETSEIDTDTTLAANSDSKIPSQKAVKTYIDSVAQIGSTHGSSAGPASSSTQTITHNLGRTPRLIRVTMYGSKGSGTSVSVSYGTYTATGNRYLYSPTGGTPTHGTDATIKAEISGTGSATGVVQNVGSTSFDIVWTVTANVSSGTAFLWEAQ